jgi:hypothetical protein
MLRYQNNCLTVVWSCFPISDGSGSSVLRPVVKFITFRRCTSRTWRIVRTVTTPRYRRFTFRYYCWSTIQISWIKIKIMPPHELSPAVFRPSTSSVPRSIITKIIHTNTANILTKITHWAFQEQPRFMFWPYCWSAPQIYRPKIKIVPPHELSPAIVWQSTSSVPTRLITTKITQQCTSSRTRRIVTIARYQIFPFRYHRWSTN